MQVRLAVVAIATVSACFADTLVLRSGKTVHGSYLGGTSRQVRMEVDNRIETFPVTDIESLQFESSQPAAQTAAPDTRPAVASSAQAAAPATPAPAQPAPAREEPRILRPDTTPAPAPAVAGAAVKELASGTAVTIRTIDDVDSQVANPGQTFRASVDDAVTVDGQTLVPRGADVVLRLTEMKDPGKLSGGGQLTLVLDSITLNGRPYTVNSATVTQAGESRKKDSAKVIGGTAALGAIIGAIAGGGKGAAIGAASGAGAGTAIQVLTQGPRVRIPSETRLTFTLQQPVRL